MNEPLFPSPSQSQSASQDDPTELFDVVDDNDQVLRQANRGEVHRLGLKHRAVHLFVFNAAGYVYLQKRSRHKDTFPGRWNTSAAGHLDAGEGYDTAMVREAREEIGIEIQPQDLQRILHLDACDALGQEFVWIYRVCHEGPFKLLTKEVESGGWFEPRVVTHWIQERPEDFTVSFIHIWQLVSAESGFGVR